MVGEWQSSLVENAYYYLAKRGSQLTVRGRIPDKAHLHVIMAIVYHPIIHGV